MNENFSIEKLKLLEKCITLYIRDYDDCKDLTKEYEILKEIKVLIKEELLK